MNLKTVSHLVPTLILIGLVSSAPAQQVSIPDPGLNAAIREALQKPVGPLTEQDLLSLTNLDASRRSITSIEGLEAARNLLSLDLQINRLTGFSVPSDFTGLPQRRLRLLEQRLPVSFAAVPFLYPAGFRSRLPGRAGPRTLTDLGCLTDLNLIDNQHR